MSSNPSPSPPPASCAPSNSSPAPSPSPSPDPTSSKNRPKQSASSRRVAFSPSFQLDPATSTWSPHVPTVSVNSLPQQFTLLTFNVLYALVPPEGGWSGTARSDFDKRRLDLVIRKLIEWDADVIALQEVDEYFLPLLLSNPHFSQFHSTHPPDSPTSPYGSPILLSRFPFQSARTKIGGKEAVVGWFGSAAGEGHEDLVLWNVHLSGGPSERDVVVRGKQIHRVLTHLASLPPTTTPVVLGDFNAWDEHLYEPFGPAGYVDAWTAQCAKRGTPDDVSTSGTYNARGRIHEGTSPEARQALENAQAVRIDRVMVGDKGAWEFVDMQVCGAERVDGMWLSDHFGLRVAQFRQAAMAGRDKGGPRVDRGIVTDDGDRAGGAEGKSLDRTILAGHVAGRINLSNKNLERLPPAVFDPKPVLDEMNAANVKNLPQWWDFQDLTRLLAADNRLVELDERIGGLGALSVLDLRNNALPALPPTLSNLPLTQLTLSNNQLTQLPDSIFLPTLQSLAVARNMLTGSLPDALGRCTALTRLEVAGNELSGLALFQLAHLTDLELSENRLTHLVSLASSSNHKFNAQLPRLRRLDIRKNSIESFGDGFDESGNRKKGVVSWEISALEELMAGWNKLTTEGADVVIEGAPKLATLDLSTNRLNGIPPSILLLPSLHRLDISNNSVSTLPPQLGLLPLNTLVFDGNPIRNLPTGATKSTRILLEGLKERIKSASVDTAEVGETSAGGMVAASVSRFGFKPTEQETASRMLNLAKRTMTDGDIATVGGSLTAESLGFAPAVFDGSDNRFTAFPGLVWSFEKLTALNLSGNKIGTWEVLTSVVGSGPAPLPFLRNLDLSKNALQSIPCPNPAADGDVRPLFPSLDTLSVSFNRLTILPGCINIIFPKLTALLAESNKITAIEAPQISLGNLEVLDLRNNDISKVPEELGLCRKMRSLRIEGNPFRVPRQAVMQQGTDAIMKYLRERLPVPSS
ncbi:hypothetical protein HDU93_007218 [Gonapodya sp. JEL0774]|nr:hypothetical protein HDU93_007218 [Gonapodya sp. JEL0774]